MEKSLTARIIFFAALRGGEEPKKVHTDRRISVIDNITQVQQCVKKKLKILDLTF